MQFSKDFRAPSRGSRKIINFSENSLKCLARMRSSPWDVGVGRGKVCRSPFSPQSLGTLEIADSLKILAHLSHGPGLEGFHFLLAVRLWDPPFRWSGCFFNQCVLNLKTGSDLETWQGTFDWGDWTHHP